MKTLNLPRSWDKMHFSNQQYYLVNTAQAKDLRDAAKIITKRTNDIIRANLRKLAAVDPWWA